MLLGVAAWPAPLARPETNEGLRRKLQDGHFIVGLQDGTRASKPQNVAHHSVHSVTLRVNAFLWHHVREHALRVLTVCHQNFGSSAVTMATLE